MPAKILSIKLHLGPSSSGMPAVSDTTTVGLADIDQERANIVKRVLSAVLRCDIVRNVFAQVIDGLPIKSTYELGTTERFELLSRTEPSKQSQTLSNQFCDSDKFDNLELNAKVCFLRTSAGKSTDLFLRLLSSICLHLLTPELSICISLSWSQLQSMTWLEACLVRIIQTVSLAMRKWIIPIL